MNEQLVNVQKTLNDVRHNLALLINSVDSEILDICNDLLNEADRKIEEIKKTNHTSHQL